jgi:hypothetical protein
MRVEGLGHGRRRSCRRGSPSARQLVVGAPLDQRGHVALVAQVVHQALAPDGPPMKVSAE